MTGGPGTVNGVTNTGSDAALAPIALMARTVHEYCVPLINGPTLIVITGITVPLAVTGPGLHDAA
jgi:hypothetical protein